MKQWFVRNDAIGNLQLASSSPAVWEKEVYFKLGEISLEQTAAGRFSSSMNNAPTHGCELPFSLFLATMDGHPSLKIGNRRSKVDALIMAMEALKASLVYELPPLFSAFSSAAESLTCLIYRSSLETRAATQTDSLNKPQED